MKDRFFSNGKINFSIGRVFLTVLMLVIVIVGGTFAWLTYRSNQSALVLTIGEINDAQVTLTPYQVTGTIIPSTTYASSNVYSDVTINKGSKNSTTLYYKINELDSTLKQYLQYKIVCAGASGNVEVKTGDFSQVNGDYALIWDENAEINAALSAQTKTTEQTNLLTCTTNGTKTTNNYRVYTWVDGSKADQSTLAGSELDMELNASIGSVTVSGTNTFGQTLTANIVDYSSADNATYSYQWYYNSSNGTSGGTAISGATEETYRVGPGLADKYVYVVVTVNEMNYNARTYVDITDSSNGTEKVSKADSSITTSTANLTYPVSSFTVSFVGDGDLTCSSDDQSVEDCTVSNKSVSYDNGLMKGTATVTVTVNEIPSDNTVGITLDLSEGSNHKSASRDVSITLSKGSLSGGAVTIYGTNRYKETLTATVNPGVTAPNDVNNTAVDSYSYQWYYNSSNSTSGGTKIDGATSSTYTIDSGLVGKYIYVIVTARKNYYNDRMISDITNYEGTPNNLSATVLPITGTINLSQKAPTVYTGSPVIANTIVYSNNPADSNSTNIENPTITYTYYKDSGCNTKTDTNTGATADGGAPIDAGNYYVKASSSSPNGDYTTAETGCIVHNITKKSVAVTWGTTTTFTYNGSGQAPTASVTTGVSGETMAVTRGTKTVVGSNYTVTASCSSISGGQAKCGNYTLTNTTSPAFSITAKAVTVTASSSSKTYDGTALTKTTGCDVTTGSLVSGHSVTCTNTGSIIDAGSTTNTISSVVIKNSSGDDVTSNYAITKVSGTLTVNKRNATVTWSNTTLTYNGSSQAPTASVTSTGVNGETMTVTVTGAQTDASSSNYTATASCSSVSGGQAKCGNYNLTPATSNFKINAKSVAVTWGTTTTFTYNGSGQAPTASVTSTGVSGETMTVTRGTKTDASDSNYTVTASCSSVSGGRAKCGNYTLTNTTSPSFKINAKSVAVTWGTTTTFTYNGSGQAPTASVTSTGVNGETMTVTRGTKIDASDSNYTVTASCSSVSGGQAKCGNYTLTNTTSPSFKINKKSVAVTWGTTTTFTYNGSGQAPTASVTTGVSGETMTVTRGTKTVVGSNYTVTASCSSVSGGQAKCGNYTLTNTTSPAFSITAKILTIDAYNPTYNKSASFVRTYGTGVSGENLKLTYTAFSANADTYTYATSAGSGKFTLTVENGTGTVSNYTISTVGDLTIGKISLTSSVTANNKIYDGNATAKCMVTLATVLSGDTVTASATGAFEDKNVGNGKTVTCSNITLSGSSAGNYSLPDSEVSKTTTANITRGSYSKDDASYLMAASYDPESSPTSTYYLRSSKTLASIKKIIFNVGTYDIDSNDTVVDVSAGGDGSVLLWYNPTEFSNNDHEYSGTVFIGSMTEYLKFTSGAGLFGGLTKLQTIEFGDDPFTFVEGAALNYIDTKNITSTVSMFRDCSSITNLSLTFLDTSNVSDMSYMFYKFNSSTQVDLTPLDMRTSGTTNASYMFAYTQNGDFNFDGTLFTSGGISNMSYMFAYMTGTGTLDLSKFNTSGVSNMQRMFFYATTITGINLYSFVTTNVTNMASMFEHAESLTSLNLSSFNTAKVTTMSNMFMDCYYLATLNISNFSTAAISNTSSGQLNMFVDMYRLSEITLGSNFKFLSSNSYLPEPSSTYITDANGYWHSTEDFLAYTPSELASFSNGSLSSYYRGNEDFAGTYKAVPYKITYYNGTTPLGTRSMGFSLQEVDAEVYPYIDSKIPSLSSLGGTISTEATAGWTFAGWSKSRNNSTIDFLYGTHGLYSYSTLPEGNDIALYAVYRRNIEFYSGSPTTVHTNTPVQFYNPYSTATTNYTTITTDNITAISGKTAYRWKASDGTLYSQNAVVGVLPSVNNKLYAVYTGTTTSSAIFYSGANGETENTVDLYYYSDINACKISTAVSHAAYSGWTSGGWRTDTDAGTSSFTTASTSASIPCSDKYYAIYTKTAKGYYGLNGVSNNTYSSMTQYHNPKSGKYSTTLPSLTGSKTYIDKDVYLSFIGWRDDTTGGNKEYSSGVKMTTSGTTYYAIYSGSVTFYSGESEEYEDDVTLYYNSANTFGSSTFPTAEAISGYTVSGWIPSTSTNVSSSLIATNGSLSTYDVSDYYAIYKVNDVSFKSGPSSSQTTATVPQYYKSDDTFILSMPAISTAADVTIGSDKYTKVGWKTNTTANTTGGSSAGGSIVTSSTAYGTNYYALYSKSITFKSGKNQATTGTSTAYYNSGSGGSVTPPTAATITNYSIKGWRTDGTASSTTSLSTSGGNPTALTYYAVYSRSIAIRSGPGTSITTSSTSVYYNTQGNMSGNTPSTAAANGSYTLVGWNPVDDIDLSDMLGLNSAFAFDAASAYSAVYQIGNITFKSGVSSATEATSMEYYSTTEGYIVNLPAPAQITGFTTLGWRADTTASTASSTPSISRTTAGWYSPGGNALSSTYYAVYSRTAQFNDTHGVCYGATQYYNAAGNYSVTTPSGGVAASVTGFTFLGWRDDTTAGSIEYPESSTSTSSSASFYAVFSRTATFYSGSGGGTSNTATQYFNAAGNYSVTTPTTAAAHSNGTFYGWISDPTATPSTSNIILLGMTSSSSANSYHAVYSRTLTFKSGINTGSLTTDGTAIQYFNGTSSKVSSVTAPTPSSISQYWSASGYSGATSIDDVTVSSTLNYGTSISPALTVGPTLYAVYQRPYNIYYDGNGADSGSVSPTPIYYGYYVSSDTDTHVKASVTLANNSFVRTGYTFNGWTFNPVSGGTTETAGSTINHEDYESIATSLSEKYGITMYAVWTAIDYLVRLTCGTGVTCSSTSYIDYSYGTVVDLHNRATCADSSHTMYVTASGDGFDSSTAMVGTSSTSLSSWDGTSRNFRYFRSLSTTASGRVSLSITCS